MPSSEGDQRNDVVTGTETGRTFKSSVQSIIKALSGPASRNATSPATEKTDRDLTNNFFLARSLSLDDVEEFYGNRQTSSDDRNIVGSVEDDLCQTNYSREMGR
jgi:hypothetical protein